MTHPLDKPQPPGTPMRQDEPDADVNPAPVEPGTPKDPGTPHDPGEGGQPDVAPSSTPGGPSTIPDPGTAPDADPDSRQMENAETSQDEPSDSVD